MRFPSNFCKIIFMCSVNFWHQQDSNSLFKGSIGHMTSQCKWPIGFLTLWAIIGTSTLYTNQSIYPKQGRKGRNLVSKMSSNKYKRQFPFGTFRPGKQGSFTVYKRISGNSGWKINRARLFPPFQYKISRAQLFERRLALARG